MVLLNVFPKSLTQLYDFHDLLVSPGYSFASKGSILEQKAATGQINLLEERGPS